MSTIATTCGGGSYGTVEDTVSSDDDSVQPGSVRGVDLDVASMEGANGRGNVRRGRDYRSCDGGTGRCPKYL